MWTVYYYQLNAFESTFCSLLYKIGCNEDADKSVKMAGGKDFCEWRVERMFCSVNVGGMDFL